METIYPHLNYWNLYNWGKIIFIQFYWGGGLSTLRQSFELKKYIKVERFLNLWKPNCFNYSHDQSKTKHHLPLFSLLFITVTIHFTSKAFCIESASVTMETISLRSNGISFIRWSNLSSFFHSNMVMAGNTASSSSVKENVYKTQCQMNLLLS